MKKRMFLSTILMTLVLLLAVTTATFAWYEVSSTGKTANLSTPDATVTTVGGTFEAAAVTLNGSLVVEPSVALTKASDGKSYVLVNGQNVVAQNDGTINKVGLATLSILWPSDVTSLPVADANAIYATFAGEYVVTISGTDLRFFNIADPEAAEPTAVEVAAPSIQLTVTLNADGTIDIEDSGEFYFAVTGKDGVQENGVTKTIVASMAKAPVDAD